MKKFVKLARIMKQYLSSEQTAKLIELGFKKPKSIVRATPCGVDAVWNERAYSIGELIEMLPRVYVEHDIVYTLTIESWGDQRGWDVNYYDGDDEIRYYTSANKLIDALWILLVKLKEEGVI